MNKVVAIVGPTGSGKSDLAVALAKALDGEVISADSMQVYKEMDIGTAKIKPSEMDGVAHHLIDIQSYREPYDVFAFQKKCREAIETVEAKGKLPILCGGTGLYVKAALYDYTFESEQKDVEYERYLESLSNEKLVALLKDQDPASLEKIHPNNRKRLIRALMIAKSGTTKSQREAMQKHEPLFDVFFVGIDIDKKELDQKVEKRVGQMFEQGLVDEVKRLFSDPESWDYTSFQGIGYREFRAWFKGEQNLDQIREQIVIHTRQYAKRQMTWLRHQLPIHWYKKEQKDQLIQDIKNWYE